MPSTSASKNWILQPRNTRVSRFWPWSQHFLNFFYKFSWLVLIFQEMAHFHPADSSIKKERNQQSPLQYSLHLLVIWEVAHSSTSFPQKSLTTSVTAPAEAYLQRNKTTGEIFTDERKYPHFALFLLAKLPSDCSPPIQCAASNGLSAAVTAADFSAADQVSECNQMSKLSSWWLTICACQVQVRGKQPLKILPLPSAPSSGTYQGIQPTQMPLMSKPVSYRVA